VLVGKSLLTLRAVATHHPKNLEEKLPIIPFDEIAQNL
jgi:hypothetical protein